MLVDSKLFIGMNSSKVFSKRRIFIDCAVYRIWWKFQNRNITNITPGVF